jgi:hypothetical protein
MPRDRHSSQSAFDADVLSPQALDRPGGVENALRAIESVCHSGGPEVARMIIALNDSRSYLLEHIISSAFRVTVAPRTSRTLMTLLTQ